MPEITKDGEVISYKPCVCTPRKNYIPKSTPLGDKVIIRPRLSVKDGQKIAEPGEKFDLDAFIQASAASTDIASILARYQAGDLEAINVNPNGFRGDSTILPKDILDVAAYQKIYDTASKNFSKLPADIKTLFNNDSADFFNSVLNGHVNDIMKKYNEQKAESVKIEKKEGAE